MVINAIKKTGVDIGFGSIRCTPYFYFKSFICGWKKHRRIMIKGKDKASASFGFLL